MVWSKVATLTTGYDWDQIWNDSAQKQYWGGQQFWWIKDQLVNECGWLYSKHPNYGESYTSSGYGGVLQSNEMTDLWTGALTRYAFWFRSGTSWGFDSSPNDPQRWEWVEAINGPTSPGTSSSYCTVNYGVADGASQDSMTAGRITAWKSDLRPGALLVLNGHRRLLFYWPGPNEVYRPYATASDPWKYQGIFMPWMSFGSSCSAGNPANVASSNYYSGTKLTAMINSQRFATGASNTFEDPANAVVGNRLYQDYWMVHSYTYQPYYKAAPDVLCYEPLPIYGGLPYFYGNGNTSYSYAHTGSLVQFDGNYWLSIYGFWFNMGPTEPDFGGAKWDD